MYLKAGFMIALLLYIIFLIHLKMKSASKKRTNNLTEYIDRDSKANFSGKKEIPKELFLNVEFDEKFIQENFAPTENLEYIRNDVFRISKLSLLKLPNPMDNIEIKFAFGVANLDIIIGGEENYNILNINMAKWAEELINIGNLLEAEEVLEKSISLGSDISKTYTLLGENYLKQGKPDKLSELLLKLKEDLFFKHNEASKNIIIKHLESLLSEIEMED